MQFMDVLVTCPDRAVAESLARTLLHERLAARANIGTWISSLDGWRGAIQAADDVPLLLKTRTAMFEQLSQHVRTLHPHEVPCIIATEVSESEPAFAAWLEAETC
jgi:periplasmic divalent cation tolerance protein